MREVVSWYPNLFKDSDEMLSGLFVIVFSMGQILGPQLGSIMVQFLGFKLASSIITGVGLVLLGAYMVFRKRVEEKRDLKQTLL